MAVKGRVEAVLDTMVVLATAAYMVEFTRARELMKEGFVTLALVVIGGTFCAYLFNLYGIKHLGASVSGSYIYSQPLFATVIAMIFLGETIDLTKIIAAVCIFMGVYFVNKMTAVDSETTD